MLYLRKNFLPLLLLALVAVPHVSCAVTIYTAPKYNLDSLCYISTDVVEASLIRHQHGQRRYEDTFTATVLDTLGGDYKIGDKIELSYLQVTLPPQPCSLCILFIARKQFQLDLKDAKVISPQVNEVLPVDSLNRVYRYSQWYHFFTAPSSEAEDDQAEQNYPMLTAECQSIKSRWTAVDQIRPLLSHAFRQEDIPTALSLCRRRQQFPAASQGLEDVVGEVVHARLADLRDPASHQADSVVDRINTISVLEHIICVH